MVEPWLLAAALGGVAGGPIHLLGTLAGRRGRRRYAVRGEERSVEGGLLVATAIALVVAGTLGGAGLTGWGSAAGIGVLVGAIGAAVACLAPRGTGVPFVALAVGAYVVAALRWGPETLRHHLLAAAVATVISIVCRFRRYLTIDGAVAAWTIGYVTWGFGGLAWFAPLLAFFLAINWIGKLAARVSGRAAPREEERVEEKGSERDHVQVLANGGICLALAVGAAVSETLHPSLVPVMAGAYLGSLCAASADTFASELGVYARAQPVLLWTFRPVPTGQSGGVTLFGYGAAVAGSLLPVVVLGLVGGAEAFSVRMFLGGLVAGVLGCTVDSVVGATLQAKRRCATCGAATERREHCGAATELATGLPFVSNDLVNVLGALTGAVLGALLLTRA